MPPFNTIVILKWLQVERFINIIFLEKYKKMVFQKYWKAEEITKTKQTEPGLAAILGGFRKDIGRKSKRFIFYLSMFGNFGYAIPSFKRKFEEIGDRAYDSSANVSISKAEGVGSFLFGSGFGLVLSFAQFGVYCNLSDKGYPEVWLIPVATNLASVIYERCIRKKLKKNAQEKTA